MSGIVFAALAGLFLGLTVLGLLWRRRSRRLAETLSSVEGALEELRESLASSLKEKEEMSKILSSMAEQVLAVNASGKILYVNPASEAIFGIRLKEALGRPFVEVVRQAAVSGLITEVLEGKREIFQEVRLFFPEEKVFEAKALPIPSEGEGGGALLVLHDISRVKTLEQVRKDFVASVSHELRTPLTSIQGFAETLLEGALMDEAHAREFVQTIHEQAQRLSRLVNDLLDLSAIESGNKPPRLSSFQVYELAKEVLDSLAPFARKHQVRPENRIPKELPSLSADRDQIKQVLLNLADNAIKFNRPEGSVIVAAEADERGFTFSVRDTGVGIPEADLARVFERFYRVDKGRSRDEGGTGLGLAIVKHIVEAHGGTVRADSALNEGSTFFVTLPLKL